MTSPQISFTLTAHRARGGTHWLDLARKTEDLGYAAIALPDHRGDQFAPVAGLAAAAAVTTTLGVTTLVLSAGVRHPALLVEELTTLDVLSEGRLTWGMGAGWIPDDYTPLGVPFLEAGERVDAFKAEIVEMKTRFSEANVTDGQLSGVQHPHPPLLIGAAQERMVRYAAASADVVHLSPLPSSRQYGPHAPTLSVTDAFDLQVAWVHDAAATRLSVPEIAVTAFPAKVTEDVDTAVDQITGPTGLTADEVLRSPHVLVGPPGAIAETVLERHQRWRISSWAIPENAVDTFAEVIALLR